jgi:peroxiredoxin
MFNRLKAAFVSVYLTVASIITAYSIWQLFEGANTIAWGGTLLAAAPMAIGIGLLMLKPVVARTSANLPEAHIPIAIGVAMSAFGVSQGDVSAEPIVLALVSYIGFLLYVYWYSRYGRVASPALTVGKLLPEFPLINLSGKEISSIDLAGHPNVILFYRGNWCPLCMAQIKEVAASYRELEALGAKVILVSPQPHKNTETLAKKFDVNFEFMTDKDSRAARALGISSEFGIPTGLEALGYDTEAPMPTVIITDANGKVLWTHETDNYRVRPEPETFLSVLKGI